MKRTKLIVGIVAFLLSSGLSFALGVYVNSQRAEWMNDTLAEAYYIKASSALDEGDWIQAQQLLHVAHACKPEWYAPQMLLSQIFASLGCYEIAVENVDLALTKALADVRMPFGPEPLDIEHLSKLKETYSASLERNRENRRENSEKPLK